MDKLIYEARTMEQLFRAYGFEQNRINQEDRKQTQALIVAELRRRMDRALRLLGTCSGEEDAVHILKQMMDGWL